MALNEIKDEYATKDLYFAAFLQVKRLTIKKLEQYGRSNTDQSSPNQHINYPVYFIFSDKKRCEELEEVFWGGQHDEAMVNVKDYFSAIRDLRARAFSVSRIVSKVYNGGHNANN